mgnify:CR=1 FL=1
MGKIRKGRRFKRYPKGCGDITVYSGGGEVKGVIKVHDLVFKKNREEIRSILGKPR